MATAPSLGAGTEVNEPLNYKRVVSEMVGEDQGIVSQLTLAVGVLEALRM